MATETGHAKNVANFQTLISFIKGYGDRYNPSKEILKVPQLEALLTDAKSKLEDVVAQKTAYNTKVNDRATAFENLKSLSTRLINALQATDATDKTIEDAKGFNKKIQGQKPSTPISKDPNIIPQDTNSTSQLSYVQQIEHLSGLISILQSEPSYAPNEVDLKVDTLLAKHTDLTTKNSEVATSYTNISNARIGRDTTLYKTENSVFEVASEAKKYIKSAFGATSPEFSQVKGIEFKKP
ncbi:hypothetical protein [Chryseobacterium sp.]|uniref:hypothetical protein n=1 Tax=Chryseobacterium sp. TaxID=1871047 RepID=UPI00388FBABE